VKVILPPAKAALPPLPDNPPYQVARQTTVFATLVYKGDIEAAAASLKMKPATVLKNVQKLSVFFNQTLVEKRDNGFYVTPFGRALYEETRPQIEAIEKALSHGLAAGLASAAFQSLRKLVNDGD